MCAVYLAISRFEDRHFPAQLFDIKQARFETVVEIGCVVRDLINQID
jgi:hypothetical protein